MKYDFNEWNFTDINLNEDRIAISGSDKDLTWKELKSGAEHFGKLFADLEIPVGHPIIIYGHKEAVFPVAILGCIHAAVAYIPIDTVYPLERVQKIAAATGAQVLINCTDDKLDIDFPAVIDKNLNLQKTTDLNFEGRIYGEGKDPIQYIIFTSGSTGEPKGVCITREANQTFVNWLQKDYPFSGEDVFMNQAPFSFDLSQYDLMNAFSFGGTLLLNSNDHIKDQDKFIDRLIEYGCSVWTSTPSFGYVFLRNERFNQENIPTMKTFLFIGEVLPNRTCATLRKLFPNATLFNAYGPTEATVATTLVQITDEIISAYPSLPVGYPMDESELFILKDDPEDNQGELVISGNHVSTGYFKNDALNADKFFMHNGKRAFKTGDLAYYENDLLFLIGRNDDQVKMNGFRIELNEISAVLSSHEAVSDAVTVALKRGTEVKKLISFVILKNSIGKDLIDKEIQPFLSKAVPYYMMPGDIVELESFPYNVSHKIDKKQLIAEYLERQFGE